jgi:hypothetical protein
MRKYIIIGIVMMVIQSGYGAFAISERNNETKDIVEFISFSVPKVQEINKFSYVNFEESTSFTMQAGNFILPVVTRVYHLPFGTTIENVNVTLSGITEQKITKKIKTAQQPLIDIYNEVFSKSSLENKQFIKSKVTVTKPYNYHIGAGRYGNELMCFLSVKMFPIHYDPLKDTLYYAQNADIKISYFPSKNPLTIQDEYDMVVITPKKFASEAQILVDHKNDHEITTKLVTLNEIYDSTYFPVEGRDCAEEVKYFLKNAFDEWGIKYVLFIGGRSGGILEEKWHVPVRYSHLDDGGEGSYLTDLYFADIYDNEANFSSWDSNENGIFAEWKGLNKDILDMYPEVYVGRIPCRAKFEVKTVINKIITYENEAYGNDWVKKFVGVAGDTYPSESDPYYEGELATQHAFNYIEPLGFDSSFIWTSNGRFTGKDDVINEISLGCGFLHFSGHGNPHVWSNHPPNAEDEWVDGPNSFDMASMSNAEKLPITIVGGCHNAQYNVSLLNILKGLIEDGLQYFSTEQPFGDFWYNEWVPRCWAWSMANKKDGGCIAIIANTGLGYGASGSDWNKSRGRVMEMNFFKSYSDGYENLGETHGMDLIYYLNEFPPMDDQIDCKIVQQWALLGDPSLMIGGYSS